jgi:site-specific DNA-methyltransferase (adenine-specific)
MSFRKETLAEGVEVYLGDCLEVLPTLGRFDLLLTDPPYGLGDKWQGGNAASKSKWKLTDGGANTAWDLEPAASLPLALSLSDNAIVWGGNYYDLPPQRGWLIWDKIVRSFSSGHVEMAWTTIDQPTRAFNYAHGELATEGKFHPTQKPLPLMLWCLGFVPAARTILDPFCGSGTSGVAAVKLGRRFTGIEIDPGYFDVACRRIADALKQPDMFIAPPKPIEQTSMFSEESA